MDQISESRFKINEIGGRGRILKTTAHVVKSVFHSDSLRVI